jgi:predicted Zn-dependent protease
LGWVYFRRGAYKAAIQHLEMSDKSHPAAVTKYHLAMAYYLAGERDRAMQALAAGSKLDPSLVEAQMASQLLSR